MVSKDKLQQVSEFLKPENLEKQTIKYEGEVALLVIDVQKEFCDPAQDRGNKQTESVSRHIQSLVPEFRKAGVPVYAVYFDDDKRKKDASEIDFYEFHPDPDDTLVAKDRNSAFKGSDIKSILRRDGRKGLLVCGFNLNVCVKETVLDARRYGFDVTLLEDMTGNDSECKDNPVYALTEMRDKCVTITTSADALEKITQYPHKPPSAHPSCP